MYTRNFVRYFNSSRNDPSQFVESGVRYFLSGYETELNEHNCHLGNNWFAISVQHAVDNFYVPMGILTMFLMGVKNVSKNYCGVDLAPTDEPEPYLVVGETGFVSYETPRDAAIENRALMLLTLKDRGLLYGRFMRFVDEGKRLEYCVERFDNLGVAYGSKILAFDKDPAILHGDWKTQMERNERQGKRFLEKLNKKKATPVDAVVVDGTNV